MNWGRQKFKTPDNPLCPSRHNFPFTFITRVFPNSNHVYDDHNTPTTRKREEGRKPTVKKTLR